MKKRVSILGSTGSVGCNALDLIGEMSDLFEVVGLTTNSNISLLREQIEMWHPSVVAVMDEGKSPELISSLKSGKGKHTKVLSGLDGVIEVATSADVDIVLSAIVGSAGLFPVKAAIEAGKQVAIASKEPVVMAGKFLMNRAREIGVDIIPIDSEPSAIFQCLKGNEKKFVKKLIITASGGPFRDLSREEMEQVTPERALAHPVWKMGKKISVDSATMINKGLEVIEAHNMFDVSISNIEVVIHPEAKIHSMVEFIDGTVIAAIGATDMRIPIQYALTYPERVVSPLKPLDFFEVSPLTFEQPDPDRFPGLKCGYEAGRIGGTMPAVLNAANEVAVEAFLGGKIKFLDIVSICCQVMEKHEAVPDQSLEEILEADRWARDEARKLMER